MLELITKELDSVSVAAQRVEAAREQILDLARSKGKLLTAIVEGGLQNIAEARTALARARATNPKSLSMEVQPLPGMPMKILGTELHTCWSFTTSIEKGFGWESKATTDNPERKLPTAEELLDYLKTQNLTIGEWSPSQIEAGVRRLNKPYWSEWVYFGRQAVNLKTARATRLSGLNIHSVFRPDRGFRIYVEELSTTPLEHPTDRNLQTCFLEGDRLAQEDWENLNRVKYGVAATQEGVMRMFTEIDVDDDLADIKQAIIDESHPQKTH